MAVAQPTAAPKLRRSPPVEALDETLDGAFGLMASKTRMGSELFSWLGQDEKYPILQPFGFPAGIDTSAALVRAVKGEQLLRDEQWAVAGRFKRNGRLLSHLIGAIQLVPGEVWNRIIAQSVLFDGYIISRLHAIVARATGSLHRLFMEHCTESMAEQIATLFTIMPEHPGMTITLEFGEDRQLRVVEVAFPRTSRGLTNVAQ